MNPIKRILLLSFFVLTVFGLRAQISADLDTLMVQKERIPLRLAETGRNISVIEKEELMQMAFTSLDDLLQYIPGIEVQSRNAFGAQGDITMRGATFSQVLVLVDGMRLNDPLTAHFNSYIPVAPAEIARIEVLRGAAAAMYGADAVGGVINIITKSFDASYQQQNEISGAVNFGENRLVNAQQGFAIKKGNSFFSGGFSVNQSDGQLVEEQVLDNTTLEAYRNYFDIKTLGFSFAQQFDAGWSLQARLGYDDRDFSARYFYTSSPSDKSVEQTQSWWNQLRLAKVGQNSSTDINLVYKNNTDQFVFSPDFASTNTHVTQLWNLNVNHLRKISDAFSLKTGFQLDSRAIESNDRGNHDDIHAGVYAMGVYQPDLRWNMTGSLRLDYDENYDLEFTPQVNISYVLPGVTFRASAGRSIRAANYTERFVSFNLVDLTPGRNLGNPDLMAERSWSEELGVDVQLTEQWKLRSTGFLRQSDNLIDYVETNANEIPNNQNLQDGANYFFARNISEVSTRGFELESWYRQSLGEDNWLIWSLGYTYLNTSNAEGIVSNYISSHARHLINTNLSFKYKSWEGALNGLYKQRNPRSAAPINADLAGEYMVWNTRVAYRLTPELALNVMVHNLFNIAYADILGARMPNRWIMAGVKFDL
ncbi:MAG TPA: TonB-dependent receptor [Saprospiraceae bacterium]|nr:TonB-dependent receptor [Saprospiraceae bacterium]